jgi:hypothetical protein
VWSHGAGQRPVVLGFTVTFVAGCFLGFVVGALLGENSAQRNNFLQDKASVEGVLTADPAFSHLRIDEGPAGSLYLAGEVATQTDHERLQARLVRAFGETKGQGVMYLVKVKR